MHDDNTKPKSVHGHAPDPDGRKPGAWQKSKRHDGNQITATLTLYEQQWEALRRIPRAGLADDHDKPCAVMRGIIGHWRIDDLILGSSLAFAGGGYEDARAELQAKASDLGYHLSAWSDADDRADCRPGFMTPTGSSRSRENEH